MTEIINLNKARKQKARQAKLEKAAQNRARTGQNKQAREALRREIKALERKLEGAKLPSDAALVTVFEEKRSANPYESRNRDSSDQPSEEET